MGEVLLSGSVAQLVFEGRLDTTVILNALFCSEWEVIIFGWHSSGVFLAQVVSITAVEAIAIKAADCGN